MEFILPGVLYAAPLDGKDREEALKAIHRQIDHIERVIGIRRDGEGSDEFYEARRIWIDYSRLKVALDLFLVDGVQPPDGVGNEYELAARRWRDLTTAWASNPTPIIRSILLHFVDHE